MKKLANKLTDDLANELANNAVDAVFTVFWANTFNESELKRDIAKLFKQHLAKAKRLCKKPK